MKRALGIGLAVILALGILVTHASAAQLTAQYMGSASYQEEKGNIYAWSGFPAPCAVPTAAQVLIEKYGPAEVVIGDSFSYQIQVSNRTAQDMIMVTLEDVLPQGFAVENIEPRPTGDMGDGKLQWNLGTIAAKSAKRIVVTGRAEQVGCLLSTTMARVCFDLTLPIAVRVVECDIELQKTLPAVADLCDDIPMTLTVTNTGSAAAANVRIDDYLPDGLVTKDGKREFGILVGTLPVGAQKTFNITLNATAKGRFTNTATATADRNCTDSASADICIVAPELELAAAAPGDGYINTAIPYQVVVTNKGDSPARDVMLVDTIAGSFDVAEVSGSGKAARGRVAWNLGTLEPGESRTLNLIGSSQTETVVVSQFTATARCANPKTVTHRLNLVGVAGVLTSVQDSVDPVIVGGTVVYTVTATNTGSRPDTNLRYAIALDDGMEYVSGNGVTAITQSGPRTLTFAPVPVLNQGQTATWQVTIRATNPGDKRFVANLVTDQLTSPVSKAESTNFYQPNMQVVVAE